ncbi:MAG: SpoIID/LytB domain-containing protein [Clostridiales bacterium]|nr:SpoIID/LytB domain-containing protein [Clostridiales bacterium]
MRAVRPLKIIVMIFLISLVMGQLAFADAEPSVDIGLSYGSVNIGYFDVQSSGGFEFGIDNKSSGFISLMDLSAFTRLNIQKDDGNHLKLGESFPTYELAKVELERMKVIDGSVYLSYDGQWHILYGDYASVEEAQMTAASVGLKFGIELVQPLSSNSLFVIIYSDGQLVLSYNSSIPEMMFKSGFFTYESVQYRNGFLVKRLPGSDMTFINRVSMSEYLYGVLPKEMSGDWPIEALKAQAVAARNYAIQSLGKYSEYGFDVCDTVKSQVYGGYSVEKPMSNLAVDATAGMVLTYQGLIAQCYYHSHSGGYTDAPENIWSAAIPYLKPVEDPFSLGSPNTDWQLVMNNVEIEQKLLIAGYNIGKLQKIRILQRTENGRAVTVQFVGTMSSATLYKEKSRTILGTTVLKSLMFSFDPATAVTRIPERLPAPGVVLAPKIALSIEGAYAEYESKDAIRVVTSRGTTLSRINRIQPPQQIVTTTVDVFEEVDATSGSVTFYGHGYGHGLGMSQWGAKKMAELGFDYTKILAHYYNDTIIESIYNKQN